MIVMKYTLADEDLRKHFSAIWPTFDLDLQAACCATYSPSCSAPRDPVLVCMPDGSTVRLLCKDIHAEVAYDDHAWNEFPGTTPEPRTWMRCERRRDDGKLIRYAAVWTYILGDWAWVDVEGLKTLAPDRYRPWETEEEDDD